MFKNRRQVLTGVAGISLLATPGRAAPAFDPRAALGELERAAIGEPFHGAFLTAGLGSEPRTAAVGSADIETGLAISPATRFGIASITKLLATLVVLKLVEAGRLALETPISEVLPGYRRDTGHRVTLAHLLSNKSGIPNGYLVALRNDPSVRNLDMPTGDAIRRYASGDLVFEPGARFDYALTNWIIVRAIIEAVAGRPFEDLVAAEVTEPLGLADTGRLLPSMLGRVAIPYSAISPPERHLQLNPAFAVASGGYYSTVEDLHRLATAVFSGRFLSPTSLTALTTIRAPDQGYALGGRVKTLQLAGAGRRFAWETGNAGGYKCLLAHGLEGGPTLVVLNNTNLSQKRVDEIAISALSRGYGEL